MDLQEFARIYPEKMKKLRDWIESDAPKKIMGDEAEVHYSMSFYRGGFTDKTLEKWQDVKRRDKDSPWYGHSGQSGKFSLARTSANILKGEKGLLAQSIARTYTEKGVKMTNAAPYAAVHQFGLKAKVYGKHEFTMPARPFMGKSLVLKQKIEQKLEQEIYKIMRS